MGTNKSICGIATARPLGIFIIKTELIEKSLHITEKAACKMMSTNVITTT
jgi:hypothetical protein